MPRHDYYIPGQWNFCCDICGFVYKSGDMARGFGAAEDAVVCQRCYTPRQPQDFVRVLPDDQSVPICRVWPGDTAIPPVTADAFWINNSAEVIPWTNNALVEIDWNYLPI